MLVVDARHCHQHLAEKRWGDLFNFLLMKKRAFALCKFGLAARWTCEEIAIRSFEIASNGKRPMNHSDFCHALAAYLAALLVDSSSSCLSTSSCLEYHATSLALAGLLRHNGPPDGMSDDAAGMRSSHHWMDLVGFIEQHRTWDNAATLRDEAAAFRAASRLSRWTSCCRLRSAGIRSMLGEMRLVEFASFAATVEHASEFAALTRLAYKAHGLFENTLLDVRQDEAIRFASDASISNGCLILLQVKTRVDFFAYFFVKNTKKPPLQGTSSSGKTTLSRRIIKWLQSYLPQDAIAYASRDDAMVLYMRQQLDKKEHVASACQDEEEANHLRLTYTPSEYQQCYRAYKKNVGEYGKRIDSMLHDRIENALRSKKVVVLDTMACMYTGASERIVPELARFAFKTAVWCFRGQPISEQECISRLGMSLPVRRFFF